MQKFIDRVKLIGREIINIITNVLIPLWGVVMLVCETFGVPDKILSKLKKVEYILWELSGTKDIIDKNINKNK